MILRQLLGYGVIGILQLGLDWLIFVALSALGIPVTVANLSGRVGGACLGYWLNGRFTFAEGGRHKLSRTALRRYGFTWVGLAVLSTLAVIVLDHVIDLRAAWIGKPLVDGGLAAIGFLASKYWIYSIDAPKGQVGSPPAAR